MRTAGYVLLMLAGATCSRGRLASPDPYKQAVVYYDEHTNRWNYGKLYANQLRNMLGHFRASAEHRDVSLYSAGEMDGYDAVFYIGSYFRTDEPLPPAFLADAAARDKPLVWINYNSDLLLTNSAYDTSRWGLRYYSVLTSGYDRVKYKGETLFKHPSYQEVVAMEVTNQAAATVLAWASSTINTNLYPDVPYAIRASNFWFFGDNLFSYDTDLSRSLVLADQLHDILGTATPTHLRAIIRVEDINVGFTETNAVLEIARLLNARGIRPAFGVIPRYQDPLGLYTGGVPEDLPLSSDRDFLRVLHECQRLGAVILCHGYTHRNDEENDVSGEGYEFWHHAQNRPLNDDGFEYAFERLDLAMEELLRSGFRHRVWETPHYEASLATYVSVADRYPVQYERMRAFNTFAEDLTPAEIEDLSSQSNLVFSTQYLPYVTYRSVWGTIIVPENLNFYEPPFFDSYGLPMTVSNKVLYGKQLRVVRDAVASFYFHPDNDPAVLLELVDQFQNLGYSFTDIETLLQEGPAE